MVSGSQEVEWKVKCQSLTLSLTGDQDALVDPGEIKIKSKKEKERERKERQKQAKKQQQSGNKGTAVAPGSPTPSDTPAPGVDEAPAAPTDGKKKKGAKDAKKKVGAPVAALRELMLARKAAEEEAKRLEEEEKARLEAIRLQEEEEERAREEARLKKKEKERLRKEELKKQGKYLTPAQKIAAAQAQGKLEALLASGVKVEALESREGDQKAKKPVYGKKKKSNNAAPKEEEPVFVAKPVTVKETQKDEAPSEMQAEADRLQQIAMAVVGAADSGVKDSWDAESDGEVKDSWDMDSEEDTKDNWDDESDEESKKEPAVTPKKETAVAAKKETAASKKSAVAVKAAPGPAKKVEEESSEEEDEEEESSEEGSECGSEDDSEDDDDSDSDEDSSDEELTEHQRQLQKRKEEAAERKKERIAAAMAARSADNLRSPICVILGHVDTGKTKLLDKIRQTNVQEGEAGGITQQIGATYFPIEAVLEKTKLYHKEKPADYKIPGLLVIDTPGHESFTNLRSRGSSLCNIAILVVDIVHGLEPQTLESLNLLRQRKTPFIVALNKIDRMFDWETHPDFPTRDTLALQKPHVLNEFNERVQKTIVEFAEQGLNSCLYWDNQNMGKYVSLIPTSAITGEGVPDLLHLLVDLTQTRMTERLMYLSELECTVLEVKVIEGLGTTIDVILSNGVLHEGDRIVICGLNGPIVTNIRALLTPQPMRELRVKSAYVHHKEIKASMGVKISAPDLEKAIAGSRLLVVGPDDDEEDIMEEVMTDLTSLLSSIDKSGKGVCVQSSTLGSLEALLTFLKASNIPVSGINIGPVHKKDIIRCSVMLERAPEYAQLLAFDVPIEKEAADLAQDMGVTIFSANIIYHLFDKFTAHMKAVEEQKRKDAAPMAIFPCIIKMVPQAIFNKRSPIIMGVDVLEGTLKVGTPLAVLDETVS